MYSESDLEAAVAGGRADARPGRALPQFRRGRAAYAGGRRGAFPAADRLQRHLRRHRRGDPARRGRLDRLLCAARISTATARRRSWACSSPRPPGAWPNSSPASGAWRCPASSCCSPSSAACSRTSVFAHGHRDRRGLSRRQRARPPRSSSPPARRSRAGAAWLHWRRFRVPITVAAGAAAAVALVLGLIASALIGDAENMTDAQGEHDQDDRSRAPLWCSASAPSCSRCGGTASDPRRETRRSDVAFWLHCWRRRLIVHPIFSLLGLTEGAASTLDGGRGDPALRRARPGGAGDRPAGACWSRRWPMCSTR